MKLLLDTHIWIWDSMEPGRIKPEVSRELDNPENTRYLSAVSIWELGLLVEKKKMHLHEPFDSWIERSQASLLLEEVALTWSVAREERAMGWSHKDPADRFLVATARVFGLTLVTADEQLKNAPGIAVLANG
jgi:PIN domain nuclease of toxin-antitoxin system